MPNLIDVMTPKEIITYLSRRPVAPRIGDALFPNRKTSALEVEYIRGAEGLPVAATLHAWDSETQVGSREGGQSFRQEMALIKRKLPIREREIIALRNPRNDAELRELLTARFNDVGILVDGVNARTEALKMEVITKGVITLNENGIVGTVDYGMPADQKIVLSGSNMFSDPAADVLGQIQGWVDLMRARGVTITRALTSSTVIRLIAMNTAVRQAINGVNSAMMVSNTQLNAFMAQQGLPQFVAYDEMYRYQLGDGTYQTRRFFDDNYIVFMPAAALGEGLFGPTAEEMELLNDPSVDINRVGNVIAAVYRTVDPVTHWTKAVAAFMPSFPLADQILSVKVK